MADKETNMIVELTPFEAWLLKQALIHFEDSDNTDYERRQAMLLLMKIDGEPSVRSQGLISGPDATHFIVEKYEKLDKPIGEVTSSGFRVTSAKVVTSQGDPIPFTLPKG